MLPKDSNFAGFQMLRGELSAGLEKLLLTINNSKLIDALQLVSQITQGSAAQSNAIERFLESMRVFDRAYDDASSVDLAIINILGINPLSEIAWRSVVLSCLVESKQENIQKLHATVFPVYQSINSSIDLVSRIISLLHQDGFPALIPDQQEAGENSGYLKIEFNEEDGSFPSVLDVSRAFSSINTFYDILSEIYKVSHLPLLLVSCDSGSNKVFDFKGSGELIKELKNVIMSIWDRVIFHKDMVFKSKIDAISDTLPILVKINKLQAEGKITPQQCHLLSRKVSGLVEDFVGSGAIIQEMKTASVRDPVEFIASQKKLLLSGPDKAAVVSSSAEGVKSTGSNTKPRVRKSSTRKA